MTPDATQQQLQNLTTRLWKVEQRLATVERTLRESIIAPLVGVPREPAACERTLEPPPLPAAAPPDSAPPSLERAPAAAEPLQPAEPPPLTPLPASLKLPRRSLEVEIGTRWVAWAGAIVVVLAAGFFLKLAYDQGWLGLLSREFRCALAALFGGALLGLGEFALRRINRAAAVGLFAAGLGVLYLTAYATHAYFELCTQGAALVLLECVALLGFAITLRARTLTVGVLSVLGGYFSPLLLPAEPANEVAFPAFLTMLLVIGLGLSAWRWQPFRPLRYVTLIAHAAVVVLWIAQRGDEAPQVALAFLFIWWALATAEAWFAAHRGQSAIGNAAASFIATAWLTLTGCWLIATTDAFSRNWMAYLCFAISGVAAALAALLDPALTSLRSAPRKALENFVVSLWAQAAVLLVVAIALHFEGLGRAIAYLALALAGIELGRRLPSRGVDVFGLLVGALALREVFLAESVPPLLQAVLWSTSDVTITGWALLAVGAVLATHCAALRLRTDTTPPRVVHPVALALLGTALWLYVAACQCGGFFTTGAWLAAAIVLLAVEKYGRRQRYAALGLAVLLLTAAKWLVLDVFIPRTEPEWRPLGTPFLTASFAFAVVLSFACVATTRLLRRPQRFASCEPSYAGFLLETAALLLPAAALILLAGAAVEVDRGVAQYLASPRGALAPWPASLLLSLWLTLLWLVGGLGVVTIGARRGETPLRNTGWVLLLLSTAAWLTLDTLAPRLTVGVVACRPLANLQFAVGLAAILALLAAGRVDRRAAGAEAARASLAAVVGALLIACGLWAGSFEIDRIFAPTPPLRSLTMAAQTGLSIYWGVFAIGLVALGFWRPRAFVRYAGLGLLGVTLAKVLLIDLSEVRYLYRVLSLLAVGLLLIVTSIAYAKLATKLLPPGKPAAP